MPDRYAVPDPNGYIRQTAVGKSATIGCGHHDVFDGGDRTGERDDAGQDGPNRGTDVGAVIDTAISRTPLTCRRPVRIHHGCVDGRH